MHKVNIAIGILLFSSIFSKVTAKDFYEIDTAFTNKSQAQLKIALEEGLKTNQYKEMESYAMHKIRQLVIIDELKFAKEASFCIIQNNIDNSDAFEMYCILDNNLKN